MEHHRYCGYSLPPEIDSTTSVVYIEFYTAGLNAGQGFSLRYSTDEEAPCGGVLPDFNGIVQWDFPGVQEHSYVDCRWTVHTDQNKTLALNFDVFDVSGRRDNYCKGGAVWMTAENKYLASHCGTMPNGLTITSPYSSTSLRLVASLQTAFRGIHGTYNTSDCGGQMDGSNAVIMSPNYPNNYPPSTDCHWVLIVPYGEIIKLVVEDFLLETDCTKDYLLIKNGMYEGDPRIGKFCGDHNPVPIISSSNYLTVIFHSNEFGTARGFKLTTSESHRGCGGLIHMHRGNFTSPKYPGKYDSNVECVWTIEYSNGYLVNISFVERFDLELDASCSRDYLQVDEMQSNGTWTLSQKFCGHSMPASFQSKTNTLRFTFHTNERIDGDGFNLKYAAACGGNFSVGSGEFGSPNYPSNYDNLLSCRYYVGQPGDYVTLTFMDFSLEAGREGCSDDYLEIFQQDENENHTQGRFCGSTIPASRHLQGPVILKFFTDVFYVSRGFTLRYEITSCGSVLRASSGTITSPLLTNQYNDDVYCTWHIIGETNKPIALRFMYFDLDKIYACYSSYLSIHDGNETGPLIGKLCGRNMPLVKSTGNQLTLRYFHQKSRTSFRGFKLFFYSTYGPAQGCGGILNATAGELSSLDTNSDGRYEPNLDCGWKILVNATDQVIKLNFTRFDLEGPSNGNCTLDYVELREEGAGGPLLGRFCGSTIPSPMISSSNHVFVHFHTNEAENKAGFKIKYTTEPSPCGSSLLYATSTGQKLQSPNYPSPYPVNLRCRWEIVGNQSDSLNRYNHRIQISVDDLQTSCIGDYLELIGVIWLKPVKICGSKHTQVLDFLMGAMISFYSDAVNEGLRGFSLTYKESSCSRNYSDDGSIIMNTGYPSAWNHESSCRMNITASAGKTISVYFKMFFIRDCTNGFMKVYDGDSAESRLIDTYCNDLPNPIFSTGRSLFLDFRLPNNYGLYHFTYITTDEGRGCGGSVVGPDGDISSPLYPQPYNLTKECKWHITVPGYHTLKLHFQEFALNSTSGCNSNYVEIFEGAVDDISARVARYCGQDIPADHEFRTNEALVKLVTDATNNQPGFLLYFDSSSYVADPSVNFVQRDISS